MKKPSFSQFLHRKNLHIWIRGIIGLLYFLFLPAAFTTAFSGIKALFTQIGLHQPVGISAFLTVLLALCGYTIVCGRFFCGYACAFGTLGDAVHGLYRWCCKRLGKKPLREAHWVRHLTWLKYGVLLVILLLCFGGVYSDLTGWSPWDVFSLLRAGNVQALGKYGIGILLLAGILVGMAVCERFFCRFLCPLGAIFSLLPVLPLFSVRRKQTNCAKGCTACQRVCPAKLTLPEDGSGMVHGDCFQCQKCVQICPKQNAHSGRGRIRGNEIWLTVGKAIVLAVVLLLAGM